MTWTHENESGKTSIQTEPVLLTKNCWWMTIDKSQNFDKFNYFNSMQGKRGEGEHESRNTLHNTSHFGSIDRFLISMVYRRFFRSFATARNRSILKTYQSLLSIVFQISKKTKKFSRKENLKNDLILRFLPYFLKNKITNDGIQWRKDTLPSTYQQNEKCFRENFFEIHHCLNHWLSSLFLRH